MLMYVQISVFVQLGASAFRCTFHLHVELKMVDNPIISVTMNNGCVIYQPTNQEWKTAGDDHSTYSRLSSTAMPQSTMSCSNPSLTVGTTTCTTQVSIGVRSQGQKQGIDSKQDKVLLKATCKGKLKEFKTFTLRNVDTAAVVSSHDLKKLIKESLHDDISSRVFNTGYMQGSNVIRVRTKEDMSEMWSEVKKQGMLWCDGLVDTGSKANKFDSKGKHVSDEDSDDEPYVTQPPKKEKKQDNEAKIQEIVDDLKSKHGTQYTVVQLRIWAELIAGGLYSSTSDPPSENSKSWRKLIRPKKNKKYNWNYHCSSTSNSIHVYPGSCQDNTWSWSNYQ